MMIEFFAMCIGLHRCPCCGRYRWNITNRWMNTAYINDNLNLLESCWTCFLDSEAHWKDMWDDHYRGRL